MQVTYTIMASDLEKIVMHYIMECHKYDAPDTPAHVEDFHIENPHTHERTDTYTQIVMRISWYGDLIQGG